MLTRRTLVEGGGRRNRRRHARGRQMDRIKRAQMGILIGRRCGPNDGSR